MRAWKAHYSESRARLQTRYAELLKAYIASALNATEGSAALHSFLDNPRCAQYSRCRRLR